MYGCAAPEQLAPESACIAGIDNQFAMEQAELALVRMNFVIDKADSNLGIIITKPLTGGQIFELWRRDNVGGYNTAYSSIHTLQRIAEVGFTETAGQVCISCKVRVERLSLPEKEIDSAGRAYSMFSRSDDVKQRLILDEKQARDMEWIDMGRDNLLEKRILERIDLQIKKTRAKGNKK